MSQKPKPPSSSSRPAGKSGASTKGGPSGAKGKSNGQVDDVLDVLAPPQSEGELGRLAHYRVLKVLGRGGMGTVFLAEDPRLNRQIALKVMLPAMAKKKVACDRFKREAQATAKIEHDHIVTIFDVNEDKGIPYLAMQVLKGMTLDDWLKAGKTLNLPQIMRIGKEIAKGLAAAHTCHLIHRDIKPSNIWLDATNKGRVKILDFGLARPTNDDTSLTQEGMILGTPAYMSPEQARAHSVDERSDLFSLGCVLYRLCTGRLPFTGKDPMAMLLAIISAEPTPVLELNPETPTALAALIHQLLAKKPEDRPASARDVVAAIQTVEREWVASSRTVAAPSIRDAASLTTAESDPALEESAITQLELEPTVIPGVTPARSGRTWVFAALGGAVVAILSLTCCLGMAIATDHGTVTLTTEGDAARQRVDEEGLVVINPLKKTRHVLKHGPQELPSGSYEVDMTGFLKGFLVEPRSFTLHRSGTQKIVLRYAPPADARTERPTFDLFEVRGNVDKPHPRARNRTPSAGAEPRGAHADGSNAVDGNSVSPPANIVQTDPKPAEPRKNPQARVRFI